MKKYFFVLFLLISLNIVFAAPDYQSETGWGTFSYQEWNCIQKDDINVKSSDIIVPYTKYTIKQFAFNDSYYAPSYCIGTRNKITKNIYLDANGGRMSFWMSEPYIDSGYNPDNTLTLPTPTKSGYTFLGWTGSNGSAPQTKVIISKDTVGESLSYTANWVALYTLTIKPNGGTYNNTTSNTTVKQVQNTIYSISEPTKTGYVFKGWTLTGGGSYSDGKYTFGTANGTLTANWKELSLDVASIVKIEGEKYLILQKKSNTNFLVMGLTPQPRMYLWSEDSDNNTYKNSAIDNYLTTIYFNSLSSTLQNEIVETSIKEEYISYKWASDYSYSTRVQNSTGSSFTRKVFSPSSIEIGYAIKAINGKSGDSLFTEDNVIPQDFYKNSSGELITNSIYLRCYFQQLFTGNPKEFCTTYYSYGKIGTSYAFTVYVRPAFVVNLSKVNYELVDTLIE